MDRRLFLKLTGVVTAASAVEALPVSAASGPGSGLVEQAPGRELAALPLGPRLTIREPGTYQISGRVQLEQPLVEISGISHTQWISWSGLDGSEHPVASFTTFQRFDRPGLTPAIPVRGGRLEALTVAPVELE